MYSNSVSDALQALARALACLAVVCDVQLSEQAQRLIWRLNHRLEMLADDLAH